MKRALALVLALVLCLGVLAGCGEEKPAATTTTPTEVGGNTTTVPTTTAPVVTTPNFNGWKLTMYAVNNKDLEANTSYANQLVESHLNMDWEIIELDNFAEQWTPMLAEGKIPSLTYRNGFAPDEMAQLIDDGAMINILDYVDKMPNVKAYLESDDPVIQNDVAKFTREDGSMYALPITQAGTAALYGYFYRADLFEKEKLTFATTQEEFYNMLKTLKTKYPSSYPFVLRQLTGNMGTLAYSWGHNWGGHHSPKGDFNTYFTLDTKTGTYYLGQTSDAYKEMAQYFVKLTNEGLLHPSSMTVNTAQWNEAFASNTSFIGFDKMDRIPTIKAACKDIEGVRFLGAAPIAMGTNGSRDMHTLWATNYSWSIGKNADLENTLKFVDWLYSEEGIQMTNWGKEGESYTVDANGTKSLKMDFIESKGGLSATGLGICMICAYKDYDAYLSSLDEDMVASLEIVAPYQHATVQATLSYNESEQMLIDTYGQPLYQYANGELSKFMLGQKDFSEWDAFKTTCMKDYKGDELLKVHQDAYARLK